MNDYNPEEPSTCVTCLDKNNLYGWATSEYLPYEKIQWIKNVDQLDIISVNKKRDLGYLSEVDLEYPNELHELHNDYRLLQTSLLFLMICYRRIVKKLLMNMT